jgi:branched-subunit amino acid ABC-type transport system permease component
MILLALGSGIVTAAVIAVGAVGFSLQYSLSRIFNISYGAMMTVSASVGFFVDVDLHTDLWVGILAAGAAGALTAVASERVLFAPFQRRRAGLFTLVMVALALDAFTENAIIAVAGPTFFSFGIPPEHIYRFLGMDWTSTQFVTVAIAVVALLAVHLLLSRTKLGKAMRATAADPELAEASGINVRRTRTVAWTLSGIFCGVGGALLAVSTASFDFSSGDSFVFVVFAAAIVGGIGQPYGAMLGALIIGLATSEVSIVLPSLEYVVAFVLLVAMLFVRPGGLIPAGGQQRGDVMVA